MSDQGVRWSIATKLPRQYQGRSGERWTRACYLQQRPSIEQRAQGTVPTRSERAPADADSKRDQHENP